MGKKHTSVEALEARRLLSVSAAALAFPLTPGAKWSTQDNDGSTDDYTVAGKTTFNSQANLTKVQDITDTPGQIGSDTSSSFAAFDGANNFVDYGSIDVSVDTSVDPAVTNTTTEMLTPGFIVYPATMV